MKSVSGPTKDVNGDGWQVKLTGSPAYCRRKADLLRNLSEMTDRLSQAAVVFAELAGNPDNLKALASTKVEYDKEKAVTQEASRLYFYHRHEHGC